MPGIVEQIELGTSSGFETAATMFGGSAALGYIVIGLLAFVLGVCVTILCFRIRLLNKEEQMEEQRGQCGWNLSVTFSCWALALKRNLVSEKPKTDCFYLTCLLGCFPPALCTGQLCWHYSSGNHLRSFACIQSSAGWRSVIFSLHPAIRPFLCGGKGLCVTQSPDCPLVGVPLCVVYCTFGDILSQSYSGAV